MMQGHQVSISSTYLGKAFTPVAPQSVRTQSTLQNLFTLVGSTSVKAVCRMLMKLSPDGRFAISDPTSVKDKFALILLHHLRSRIVLA